jgi:hypothetical protein
MPVKAFNFYVFYVNVKDCCGCALLTALRIRLSTITANDFHGGAFVGRATLTGDDERVAALAIDTLKVQFRHHRFEEQGVDCVLRLTSRCFQQGIDRREGTLCFQGDGVLHGLLFYVGGQSRVPKDVQHVQRKDV